ncbi:putative ATP-dependent DNA ligase [Bacillus phage BCD7]|uniref:DNA ligase n=1 Tax=Bacillus phage BCD7 TaxID=1136534 RepID=J9PUM5_9CAUD|nr:putative ATP-dependent DNA ligase [Bacillus phage BCD7]AEZ50556.1 putative ATP-dependent DNA ligase [Bacillus phage BCD7]
MSIKRKAKVKNKKKTEVKAQTKNKVTLISNNNNGLFEVTTNAKGKEVRTLNWEGVHILNEAGKVISENPAPKYMDASYTSYMEDLKRDRSVLFLEPMGGFENDEYFDQEQGVHDVAELKLDGHRGLLHMGTESNRNFSRNIIKRTDWWGENSDCVPHIRDSVVPNLAGTVLDGEFDYGTDSMHVQSVMGSLPANAVQYQFENGFISFYAFDILYYKGINIQAMPLWKRKYYLMKAILEIWEVYGREYIKFHEMYMPRKTFGKLRDLLTLGYEAELDVMNEFGKHCIIYEDNFYKLFLELTEKGKEGIMIKNLMTIYEQKKTKNLIKAKEKETWDVIITNLTLPTKKYEGKLWEEERIEEWRFWEYPDENNSIIILEEGEKIPYDVLEIGTPVSKPYAMGWCGGIDFAVIKKMTDEEYHDLVNDGYEDQAFDDNSAIWIDKKPYWLQHVGTCKGLNEQTMEDLKQNGEKYIKERRVLEVLANGIIDKETGSLRHPRFKQWRDDKNFEQCTFNAHIRKEED